MIGMNSESHGGSVPSVLPILPEPACSCISTEFVLFVHGQYSDNQLKQVKALNVKLDSLPMVGIHSAINSEASNVAHKILSLDWSGERRQSKVTGKKLVRESPSI